MNRGIKTIVALLICAAPGVAAADPIVFENSYEDGQPVAGTAWCSGCGTLWRVWDNFTLSADTEITQIDARAYFTGSSDTGYAIEYSVWTPDRATRLFSQVLPVAELSVNRLFSESMESDLYAAMTGLRLAAGEYALSIWDMAHSASDFGWYATSWEKQGDAYQSFYEDGAGNPGGGNNLKMAFRVRGNAVAVPEPGTLALLGLGLAGLAYSRRCKA